MDYSIVFESRTGNTAILAQTIQICLNDCNCIYFGPPCRDIQGIYSGGLADLVFAGFWTDKGTCSETMAHFLESLDHSHVFLFGTAGFGESKEYFSQILSRIKEKLPSTAILEGSYMCQGKMPLSVRNRYEKLLPQEPEKMKALIRNFDKALIHPDEEDQKQLIRLVEKIKISHQSP